MKYRQVRSVPTMKSAPSIVAGAVIVLVAFVLFTPSFQVAHGIGNRKYRASFANMPPLDCTVSYALVLNRDVPVIIEHYPLREVTFTKVDDSTAPLELVVGVISRETKPLMGRGELTSRLEHDTLLILYEFNDGRREFQPLTLPGRERPHIVIPPIQVEPRPKRATHSPN